MANRRGITHIKPNELSGGKADSPDFSKAHVGSGFAWGIRQGIDKGGVFTVPNAPNSALKGTKPRKGVWHPNAVKP